MENIETYNKFAGRENPATQLANMNSGLSDEDIKRIEGEDKSEEMPEDDTPVDGVVTDNSNQPITIDEPIIESKKHIKSFSDFNNEKRSFTLD